MDTPLEIAFHNVDKSDALEAEIRERADKLHRRFDHINSCRVVVEAPHRSQVNPLAFHVRIETRVPGKELVVSKDPGDQGRHFDPLLTVRDAFKAMDRQLEQFSQKIRGEVKTHEAPLQGRVLRKLDDYGFIATTDGREIYFHKNAVVDQPFDAVEEGQPVELVVATKESPHGPQASTVRPIGAMEFDPRSAARK